MNVGAGVSVGAGVCVEVTVGCIARISTGVAVEGVMEVAAGATLVASGNGRHAARKMIIRKRVRNVRSLCN